MIRLLPRRRRTPDRDEQTVRAILYPTSRRRVQVMPQQLLYPPSRAGVRDSHTRSAPLAHPRIDPEESARSGNRPPGRMTAGVNCDAAAL